MSEYNNETPRNKAKKNTKKKKKNNLIKTILIVLAVILLFGAGLGISALMYGYNTLDKIDKVEIDESNLGINEEIKDKLSQFTEIQNIALFGIDATDSENGRSDSIMILSIDKKNKKLKISSIMRDSYVTIPGRKNKDKINHAYAYGGPELALKTLNQNFNLNITDFVSVNFTNLPKIIDALGGLDLDITKEEINVTPGINDHIRHLNQITGSNSPVITRTGMQHVNGTQALAYTRIRYTAGGDSERTERHRIVINQLLDKFKSTSPTKYPALLNELLPLVQTSLSSSEILNLATSVLKMGNITLEQNRFPEDGYCTDAMINGVYYLKFDEEATIEQIHDFIYGDQ